MRSLRGLFDELTQVFARGYDQQILAVEADAEKLVDDLLNPLSQQQLNDLLSTIRARRGLVDTNAAYGNEVVSTSKQILAFGGAGIGLVAAFAPKLSELPPLFLKFVSLITLFYLNLTALSLFTILGFVWITRFRYPFLYLRKIGNTTPFFYYQAISPEVSRYMIQTAKEKFRALQLYAEDFVKFVQYLAPPTPTPPPVNTGPSDLLLLRKNVRDELQQYFLLISYQGYVNQFEVLLNNDFLYGLIGSIAATFLAAIYVFVR